MLKRFEKLIVFDLIKILDILRERKRTRIPKTHDLGFCFFPLLVFRNCLLGDSLLGLMFAPQTDTASPAAKMFLLALISRSCRVPHLGQSHSRTLNGSLSTICPQLPHRLELGNHRSILTRVRPYQSHLYSSCLTNSPQLASLIARASFRFLTIFFTAKSSTAIVWFSRTNRVVIKPPCKGGVSTHISDEEGKGVKE
jgi:hypothetical protein